jgi:hypothetical protein
MTPRELEEYKALRATIRERGTMRVWLLLAGFVAWAALAVATAALAALPISTLLPLLILAVAFEIVFALYTGIERIGRYIQVYCEDERGDRGWEHRAMAYGARFPAAGGDALLALYFWLATLLNLMPMILAEPTRIEWVVVGGVHLLFAGRVAVARLQAGRQRGMDLERFRTLRRAESPTTVEQGPS